MKSLRIPTFALLIISLLYAPDVLALKRVPFPNNSALQPMSSSVQPNISHNVNSNSDQTGPISGNQNEQGSLNTGSSQQSFSSNSNQNTNKAFFLHNLPLLVIFLSVVLLVFALALRKWKRRKL